MIYLDNYEGSAGSVEEVRRSLLIALIDRKGEQVHCISGRYQQEAGKGQVSGNHAEKSGSAAEENRFDLLEEVKTVNIGNEMAVTIEYRYWSGWPDLCTEL